ncbi:MAG: zinc metalloprotease HtpX [Candidatus Bathyarchaeia archaeon]
MSGLWKLRLSMVAALAIIITLSTLVLAVILSLLQVGLIYIGIIVVAFNILQWLVSPYIIDAIYRVREIPESENPRLHAIIDNLSRKSGIKKPKLMLARIPIPNAFAYGSPIAGSRVAVTEGLLKTLNEGEVEAVIGHELGHLKHRDVQVMMIVSLLPAIFYYVGYSLVISSMYSRRQREEGGGTAILGMGLVAFSMFLTYVCVSFLSRVREYYADRHSATIVENGAQKLSLALAKIVNAAKNLRMARRDVQHLNAFKALFIADPDRAKVESLMLSAITPSDQKLVEEILSQKLTWVDRLNEIFSTHPHVVKRIKALQELS